MFKAEVSKLPLAVSISVKMMFALRFNLRNTKFEVKPIETCLTNSHKDVITDVKNYRNQIIH